MEDTTNFWTLIGNSIFHSDLYILIAAVTAFILFLITMTITNSLKNDIDKNSETKYKKFSYKTLVIPYTVFLSILSLFPLLGMFGTVKALLELDFSAPSTEMKANFFHALTSTAWGIIFSVFFKFINSLFQTRIEMQITKLELIMKDNIINGDKNEET